MCRCDPTTIGSQTVAADRAPPPFDDPREPLRGWQYDYEWTNNAFYRENHKHVSVLPRDGARQGVLKLSGTRDLFWASGQGVQVDSLPIAFEPGASYRLSVAVRSTLGPNCRIYIEGYDWKPGVQPHAAPAFAELRKVYKGAVLRLGPQDSGPFSGATREWQQGTQLFPAPDLSPLARQTLAKVRFIAVHIVAIDGTDGDLLVDDVRLERAGAGASRAR